MLPTSVKSIFLLVAMAAHQVTLVSGLKCYECMVLENEDVRTCLAPDPKSVNTGVHTIAPVRCFVSVSYKKPTKQSIIEINRSLNYLLASDVPGLAKTGDQVMDDCSDIKKFPQPVLVDGEYWHGCYCAKDFCNSAIIPDS